MWKEVELRLRDTSTRVVKTYYKFAHIDDVGDGLRLWRNVASITSLNAWLVMCRASNSWAVPTLSSVKDCIRDMCTPKSRWMPLHSMHTIMPKFVDSHVASEKETIVVWQQNAFARTRALAKLPALSCGNIHDNAPCGERTGEHSYHPMTNKFFRRWKNLNSIRV